MLALWLGCGFVSMQDPPVPPGCRDVQGQGCYWMDNGPGKTCWVPIPQAADQASCQALDSCSGGGGASGGGCYKWARCSACGAEQWR